MAKGYRKDSGYHWTNIYNGEGKYAGRVEKTTNSWENFYDRNGSYAGRRERSSSGGYNYYDKNGRRK